MAQRHLLAKVLGLAATGLLVAAAAASGETLTFTLPANPIAQPGQRWTVPGGVCSATFDLFGTKARAPPEAPKSRPRSQSCQAPRMTSTSGARVFSGKRATTVAAPPQTAVSAVAARPMCETAPD